MFTGNTIALSDLAHREAVQVLRDCEMSFIGKIPTNLPRRFVPCETAQHVASASTFKGIAGIVTKPEHAELVPQYLGLALSEEPVKSALILHEKICGMEGFLWESFDSRIHPSAIIHPTAVIAERDVVIGPGSHIGPGSVVMERSVIRENCHVGVGVVVGLDAFEIFEGANPRRILRQAGGVFLEDGATILAKSTLVRATFGGYTRLQKGCMVDVLVYIAHDVILGENTTVVAGAEISGRCELGKGAYIGPNACLRNGVRIGENARVSLGAVVTRDVPDGETVSGNFAVAHNDWLKFVKSLRN